MPNTYLDKAIAAVPKFGERISLFTKKLRLAQYADSSIYDYRLKISQAALYLNKLPDDFTQADIDSYLSMLLDRNRYSISHFKHTVFGLKDYYKVMGLKEPKGLVLPKVRKAKRLPRVLSQEQVARLIHMCDLYDKALLSTIYDCALRVSEACSLKWVDISFDLTGLSGSATTDSSPCNREILRSIQQQLSVPPVPKVRKKKSYLDICIEKGWDIGICKDCNCQRIITRIIKPATRAPPFKRWHMVK